MNRYCLLSLFLFLTLVLGGCGVAFDELLAGYDDYTLEGPNTPAKLTQKVYLLGDLGGDLQDELHEFIEFTMYDNTSIDAPIVMAGNTVLELTAAQTAGLVATFNNCMPIVLIDADVEQIVALHVALGDSDFEFYLPHGIEYAEIYAVDLEDDGSVWQWESYPPSDDDLNIYDADFEDASDDENYQDSRVANFLDWLCANDQRFEDAGLPDPAESSANGASDELTLLTSAFVSQKNFTQFENHYQVVHYMYGCHSVDTGEDWLYIQQQCVFYNGGALKPTSRHRASEHKGWYMNRIELDSYVNGYDNDTSKVGMMQSSPETVNNTESVTSGVSWKIGGEVSYGKDGLGGGVSAGVTISNSRTIDVKDCKVVNKSNDRGNNAHWVYEFKRCTGISGIWYGRLTNPPELSVNTFQPLNQWIWRMNPEVLNRRASMRIKLNTKLCYTKAVNALWIGDPEHSTKDGGSWVFDVPIQYPAILVP